MSIDGTIAANVTVAPDATVQLGTAEGQTLVQGTSPSAPGGVAPVWIGTTATGALQSDVPVVDGTFEQYQSVVDSIPPLPVATPTPTPSPRRRARVAHGLTPPLPDPTAFLTPEREPGPSVGPGALAPHHMRSRHAACPTLRLAFRQRVARQCGADAELCGAACGAEPNCAAGADQPKRPEM